MTGEMEREDRGNGMGMVRRNRGRGNGVDDDDDESKSYVRPLLQLETVTSVLVIRPGKQFSFQITTKRGCKLAAAYRCWKRIPGGRSCHGGAARTVSERPWRRLGEMGLQKRLAYIIPSSPSAEA